VAARPPTLTIAITPVLVGTALAWHEGAPIQWLAAAVALCAAVLIQVGTNLYNDVGDYERGADRADRLGPPRATSIGWLAAADVRRAAATSFGLAMVLGAYLVSVGGWPIFVVGLASIAAGIGYTGGPRPIAYTASGEFFVFVFFGLMATAGSAFLQTGRLSWAAAAAGAMIGALAAAVLVVNNYRDRESDRRSAKITLAVRIGYRASRWEYAVLTLLPFAALPGLAALTGTGLAMLLPAAAAPVALRLVRDLARAPIGPGLNLLLKRTARLELVFGLLVCAAFALSMVLS
jgi:1,4-dihydroxy-2-naphthoate octaprenyltransferase